MTRHSYNVLRHLFSIVIAMLTGNAALADNISVAQAEQIARNFLAKHDVSMLQAKPQRVKGIKTTTQDTPYYIFNSQEGNAFVVVSGESETRPVLAYSLTNGFNADSIAPGAAFMLRCYEEQIEALRNGATPAPRRTPLRDSELLLPTAKWNQSWGFWWGYTPIINDQHTHAGCVATAMAIIMRYHEWPEHGYGSHSYVTDTYKKSLSAKFEGVSYHLSELPVENEGSTNWTKEKKDWIARLLYHCGVAANLDYGPYVTSGMSPEAAMYQNFGYTLGTYVDRNETNNDEQWLELLYNELDKGTPILYHGEDSNGANGHLFVCDGYDTDGLVHFNFGWSGQDDGYYYIDDVVTCNYELSFNQGIVIGMYPDRENATKDKSELFIKYSNDSDNYGLYLKSKEKIYPDTYFSVYTSPIANATTSHYEGSIGAFICDKDGKRKQRIGLWTGASLDYSFYYYWIRIDCLIPSTYNPEEGDRIYLYSSTDQKKWHRIECADNTRSYIDIDKFYIPTPVYLTLGDFDNGYPVGLECDAAMPLSSGNKFNIFAYNLYNATSETFYGSVGAFLCDSKGNPYQRIGYYSGMDLQSQYYYYQLTISCKIPNTVNISPTDRIYLFTSKDNIPTTSNSVMVPCSKPEQGTY